jgi:hypothetical protein
MRFFVINNNNFLDCSLLSEKKNAFKIRLDKKEQNKSVK